MTVDSVKTWTTFNWARYGAAAHWKSILLQHILSGLDPQSRLFRNYSEVHGTIRRG
jgi:hypothetical protein